MKTILNILLIFLSKKTRIKLSRKLELLETLSGKRCLDCREFLYDITFDNPFCPSCRGYVPERIKYDPERLREESEKKRELVRINFEGDKKGYQILHPCKKCGIWNDFSLSKWILKLSEQQFKIPKAKGLKFVTSLDPEFQLEIKKGIDKDIARGIDKGDK